MSGSEITVPETKKEIKGQVVIVPIDTLQPNPWNPNRQSDFIFEKEKISIHEHGFIDPVLARTVEGQFQIIDGEHRWKAAKELGYGEISVLNLGEVADAQAKKLTIILNETRGKADYNLMGKLLQDLSQTVAIEELAYSLPYTQMEIETMMVESNVDWDSVGGSLSNGGAGAPGTGENKKISISVPESVHQAFMDLIDTVNAKLFPDVDPSDCDAGDAIAAICQVMNQIDIDAHLKGNASE
jgi:ParB/RepB/Spo0J family partition protein